MSVRVLSAVLRLSTLLTHLTSRFINIPPELNIPRVSRVFLLDATVKVGYRLVRVPLRIVTRRVRPPIVPCRAWVVTMSTSTGSPLRIALRLPSGVKLVVPVPLAGASALTRPSWPLHRLTFPSRTRTISTARHSKLQVPSEIKQKRPRQSQGLQSFSCAKVQSVFGPLMASRRTRAATIIFYPSTCSFWYDPWAEPLCAHLWPRRTPVFAGR